jgi:hypothetical protein
VDKNLIRPNPFRHRGYRVQIWSPREEQFKDSQTKFVASSGHGECSIRIQGSLTLQTSAAGQRIGFGGSGSTDSA